MIDLYKVISRNISCKVLLIIATLSVFFISCKTYEPIKIQVLKPAQIPVTANLNSVLLINHCNYQKKIVFVNTEDSSQTEFLKFNLDSIRTMQYFEGLMQVLNNSPRYKVINPNPIYITKPNFTLRYKSMDWSEIHRLCAEHKADAAIVLENYQVIYDDKVELKYVENVGYYGNFEVQNSSLWKIYYPENKKFIDDYILKDTLFWDAFGIAPRTNIVYDKYNNDLYREPYNYGDEVYNQLPEVNDAIMQSCFYAGTLYGERIAQTWTTKNRYIMSCGKLDFINATQFAKSGKWDDAIKLWKKYPYGDNNRLAAMAAYNLAIASETLDNIDAALEWAAKSYLLRNDIFVQKYVETLEVRKKEKDNIENQLK